MAEKSIFWPTNGTGDGASPYTTTDLTQWIRHMTGNGVHPNFGNECGVTGTSSPLMIGYGAAIVNGIPYWSTADVSLAVPVPTSGTTGHTVVLRADWATQTVRAALRSSPDGNPAFPDPVVDEGTVSEIVLAHVSAVPAGSGGGLTVTDARDYVNYRTKLDETAFTYDSIPPGVLQDNAVFTVNIAARTCTLFVPATSGLNYTAGTTVVPSAQGMPMLEGKHTQVYGSFRCPHDFVSTMTVYPIVYAFGVPNGDIKYEHGTVHGAAGETYNQHGPTPVAGLLSVVADKYYDLPAQSLPPMALGDNGLCSFDRYGDDPTDTTGDITCVGFLLSYTGR